MSMDWYDRRLLAEISEALQPELKRIGDILYDLTYKTEVERRTIFRKEKIKEEVDHDTGRTDKAD